MKKIFAFILAAGMVCSFAGCNENNNEESSVLNPQQEAENPNMKITPADTSFEIKPASGTSYSTDDGKYKFNIDDKVLSVYEGSKSKNYNFAFSLNEDKDDSLIGVKSIPDAHQNVNGYCEDMQQGFVNIYKDVEGSPIEINGVPAYEIKFDYNSNNIDSKFCYITAQYGNGDLLTMVYAVPEADEEIAEEQIRNMMASVEYLGSPLKTEPETHENDYFKITIDKDLYFNNADDKNVMIRPNIAENGYEAYCTLLFEADPEATAQQLADTDKKFYDDSEEYKIISEDNEKILGLDAIHIRAEASYPEMTLVKESYLFEKDGKAYRLMYYTPLNTLESFKEKTQSAVDSITLK